METECRFRVLKLGAFDLHKSCECLTEVSKNKVIDLLRYESTPSRSRRDFVSQAWRFIDQGADVYTLVRDARLIACCWIVAGTRMASPESPNLGVPAGTALLLRFYAHAEQDRAKLLKVLLKKWTSELASPTDTIGLSIAISESGLFETIESTDDDTRSPSAIALNGCPEIL
jgi:hypothetical protein